MNVLVVGAPGHDALVQAQITAAGGLPERHLGIINGFSAQLPLTSVPALRLAPGIRSVTPNAGGHLDSLLGSSLSGDYNPVTDVGSMYNTTLMTGARSMWSRGFTGKGVDIALIDSGIAPVNGVTAGGKVVNGADLSFDSQATNLRYLDTYGHGTHMAGIIAGRDNAVGSPSSYAADSADFLGMAPDARLVNVKVADAHGATDVTQVIAALDWVLQHRYDNGLNIRVVNLSYGTDSAQPYALDPLAYAAEVLWHAGIVVVAAGGNYGVGTASLDDPAYDPYLLAAGAADTHGTDSYADDTPAGFSNWGDLVRDPDVLAPGVHIQSLRVPGSYVDLNYSSTGAINSRFFRGSGTSQAAAVVSGAAALLLQEHPTLTPDALKQLLVSTADNMSLNLGLTQGARELDLARASSATPVAYQQAYPRSDGLGLVEASRGTHHLVMNGVALTGEQDVFGQVVNTASLGASEASAAAWNAGSWNGNSWSGNSWSGNSWSGNSWSGNSWSGNSWSGNSWSSVSWSGNSWSGNSWSGNSWSTNDWSGGSWATGGWACAGWS